jgi:hypothetical protein
MTAAALIAKLAARGIYLVTQGEALIIDAPKGSLQPGEVEHIRARKAELLNLLHSKQGHTPAARALAMLNRLRCYTIAGELMPIMRLLAEQLRSVSAVSDDAEVLTALQGFESELIALGASLDTELADTIATVESAFPGTKLIEVRPKVQ